MNDEIFVPRFEWHVAYSVRIRAASDKARLAARELGMPASPVKTDLRPGRSQIDALLVGIPMNAVDRAALLDAFKDHGLLAYTEPSQGLRWTN